MGINKSLRKIMAEKYLNWWKTTYRAKKKVTYTSAYHNWVVEKQNKLLNKASQKNEG